MRLVGVLLSVTLLGSAALADDAKPADPAPAATAPAKVKVPLRVVRVLPETNQALLFDRNKGTHVLVEVGEAIEGYTVDDIDGDEVTLLAEGGATVVLAAPDQSWRREGGKKASGFRLQASGPEKKAEPAPQDPYGTAAPQDPYGDEPVRSVEAPTEQPVRGVQAPTATTTATAPTPSPAADTAPATVAVPAPAPVRAPAAAPAPAADSSDGAAALAAALTGDATPAPARRSPAAASPAAPESATVTRASVDAALADFAGTAASLRAAFTPAGLRIDSVASTSIFARAGLRAGDTVTAVNNQPLRSIDDAANLYARASTARALTVQITRENKPLTLHIAIQ